MRQFKLNTALDYCSVFLFIALAITHSKSAIAEEAASPVFWSGYIKNETAYRFREPRSYTKIRNILQLKAFAPTSERTRFTAVGRAYHDSVYDIFDYDTIAARSERDSNQPLAFVENLPQEKDSDVIELRELYLDVILNRADIRIGKQIVVWGVLTGVRIIDEINPMDFREFILPELLDYRIPLWTFKLDYYFDDFDTQFLWIPDLRFHKPAPQGSEWELFQEVPGTVYPESFQAKNSELGIRFTTSRSDTEISLSYFYTWDDFPVILRTVRFDAGDAQGSAANDSEPVFVPQYKRLHIFGLTFQKEISGNIAKAEFAFIKNKYFGIKTVDLNNDNILDYNGARRRNHIRMGYGVDFNAFKTEFSPSVSHWYILNYDPALIQREFDTSVNLFIRKPLAKPGTVFELLSIYLVNLDEVYLKPKFILNITNRAQIIAGLDLFYGNPSVTGVISVNGNPTNLLQDVQQSTQFIGNFDKNDRVFLELKYNF